jgi:hypothetical protein
MYKIEKYLCFHDQIPKNKRWLEEDSHFVPPRNYEPSNNDSMFKIKKYLGKIKKYLGFHDQIPKTLDEWIGLKWKNSDFKHIMIGVFSVEAILASVLIFLIILGQL